MLILGITGGSGCGKSTVSEMLRKSGVDVIDGDFVAREIVKPQKPALSEIIKYFGDDYINCDGSLNRKKLANHVFSNPNELKALNKITHKYITTYIKSYFSNCNKDIVGIDAAALIESGLNSMCDYVLSVLADNETRANRIIFRDSISEDEANCRISAQKDDIFYIENSDYIVYNNSSVTELHNQIENILNDLRSKF